MSPEVRYRVHQVPFPVSVNLPGGFSAPSVESDGFFSVGQHDFTLYNIQHVAFLLPTLNLTNL